MSKILLSAGPIPAKLDSVKYITNRFKGGLALKLAQRLQENNHDVTVAAWKHSDIAFPNVIYVEDVYDYYEKVLNFEADAYILSAAVANLGPKDPIIGKFPSHNYKLGDVFPIDFTIMPRVIDAIKDKYPRSTLIAYKLFDGTNEELIDAARHTLYDSKANLVFANHPAWAKVKKIAITADGSCFSLSFDEHIDLILKLLDETFYQTKIIDAYEYSLNSSDEYIIENYPKYRQDSRTFGTFAIRDYQGFITTTRGKSGGNTNIAYVQSVDHEKHIVYSNKKATLNAPLLDRILNNNPHINYLIHGHENIGIPICDSYQFPGTTGDLQNGIFTKEFAFCINLPEHGYIAGFSDYEECKEFIDGRLEQI